MLYSICEDRNETATQLNNDLRAIQEWAYQWKMSFNPDPSKQAEEILFSQKSARLAPAAADMPKKMRTARKPKWIA